MAALYFCVAVALVGAVLFWLALFQLYVMTT